MKNKHQKFSRACWFLPVPSGTAYRYLFRGSTLTACLRGSECRNKKPSCC